MFVVRILVYISIGRGNAFMFVEITDFTFDNAVVASRRSAVEVRTYDDRIRDVIFEALRFVLERWATAIKTLL